MECIRAWLFAVYGEVYGEERRGEDASLHSHALMCGVNRLCNKRVRD